MNCGAAGQQVLKANNANIKDKEFLAEHGHKVNDKGETMRVVLVTQDLSQISSWARDLVDKTYRTTKLDAVGSTKRFRIDIYQGAVTGQRPPKTQIIRQIFDKYEAEYYKWYKSATHSQTGDVGDESRSDKRANGLKRPSLIALGLFVFIAPIFGVWGLSKFFSQGEKPQHEVVQQAAIVNPLPPSIEVSKTVNQMPEQIVNAVPGQPTTSPFWRVAGYVDLPSKTQGESSSRRQVLLAGEPAARRIIPIESCKYYDNGIDVYCDIDGYRVTPWFGRSATTSVFDATSGSSVDLTGRSEQREQRAVKPTEAQAHTPNSVVVVADNSRQPRTLN